MNELMDLNFYNQIKEILVNARSQVYAAANSAMVQAYWSIGKSIYEQQGNLSVRNTGSCSCRIYRTS